MHFIYKSHSPDQSGGEIFLCCKANLPPSPSLSRGGVQREGWFGIVEIDFICIIFYMVDLLITPSTIHTLKNRYGFQHLRIFWSYARGEQNDKSDIDLIFQEDKSKLWYDPLWFVDAHNYLKRKLKKRIDLTEKEWLHPLISGKVLRSMKQLW